MSKKIKGFNTPFSALKGVTVKTPEKKKKPVKKAETEEPDLFELEMKDVVRIENDLATPGDLPPSVHRSAKNTDTEVIEKLTALVEGTELFDVSRTGEYLEGHIVPIDFDTMTRLRSGDFSIQDHLDLHGLSSEGARQAVETFVKNSHAMGRRCILIIHGRGLRSPSGPVLKNDVVRWLTTGSLSHLVLAFCTARPCDGGGGAMYVLLKSRPARSKWKRPF